MMVMVNGLLMPLFLKNLWWIRLGQCQAKSQFVTEE
jgi:hypothetical protein